MHWKSLKLTLNVYTYPGFLGALMAIINIVAVYLYFKPTDVDVYTGADEAERKYRKSILLKTSSLNLHGHCILWEELRPKIFLHVTVLTSPIVALMSQSIPAGYIPQGIFLSERIPAIRAILFV